MGVNRAGSDERALGRAECISYGETWGKHPTPGPAPIEGAGRGSIRDAISR